MRLFMPDHTCQSKPLIIGRCGITCLYAQIVPIGPMFSYCVGWLSAYRFQMQELSKFLIPEIFEE